MCKMLLGFCLDFLVLVENAELGVLGTTLRVWIIGTFLQDSARTTDYYRGMV